MRTFYLAHTIMYRVQANKFDRNYERRRMTVELNNISAQKNEYKLYASQRATALSSEYNSGVSSCRESVLQKSIYDVWMLMKHV